MKLYFLVLMWMMHFQGLTREKSTFRVRRRERDLLLLLLLFFVWNENENNDFPHNSQSTLYNFSSKIFFLSFLGALLVCSWLWRKWKIIEFCVCRVLMCDCFDSHSICFFEIAILNYTKLFTSFSRVSSPRNYSICENIFQKLHNRINVAQEGKEWKLAEILSSG